MASEAPNDSARVGTTRVSRQAIGHEPALADALEAGEAVAFTTAWADEVSPRARPCSAFA